MRERPKESVVDNLKVVTNGDRAAGKNQKKRKGKG